MGVRYIIGDCHLGHKNISNFRKMTNPLTGVPYSSEEQHQLMIEQLSKINKRDTLFLLGDIAFDKESLELIKSLPCSDKILICGNHDLDQKLKMQDLIETYDKVFSLRSYKRCWLSHAPIHPMELRGKLAIHGHTHYQHMLSDDGVIDSRYVSVCAEYTGFKPIKFEHAISGEYHEECQEKFDKYVKLGYCSGTLNN